jgi:hypothetical protein
MSDDGEEASVLPYFSIPSPLPPSFPLPSSLHPFPTRSVICPAPLPHVIPSPTPLTGRWSVSGRSKSCRRCRAWPTSPTCTRSLSTPSPSPPSRFALQPPPPSSYPPFSGLSLACPSPLRRVLAPSSPSSSLPLTPGQGRAATCHTGLRLLVRERQHAVCAEALPL